MSGSARASSGSPRARAPGRRRSGRAITHASSGSRARTSKPPPARAPASQLAAVRARRARASRSGPWPAPASRRRAGAVVADLELERAGRVAQRHLGARAAGVLERVGERLLHDAVRATGRRPAAAARALALDGQLTGNPARRTCSTSTSTCARPGCGASSSRVAVAAQHAEQPAHLGQRLRGRPARSSRAPRASLGWSAVEHVAPRPGLDDHHADVVGDDVVQLARDPRPLLGHRLLRAQLAARARAARRAPPASRRAAGARGSRRAPAASRRSG